MTDEVSKSTIAGGLTVLRPASAPHLPVEGDAFMSCSEEWGSPDGSKKVGSTRILKGAAPMEFEQQFPESAFILSGHMAITLVDGSRIDLREGDLAQVLPGTKCTIEIVETVHFFFVMTSIKQPVEV